MVLGKNFIKFRKMEQWKIYQQGKGLLVGVNGYFSPGKAPF